MNEKIDKSIFEDVPYQEPDQIVDKSIFEDVPYDEASVERQMQDIDKRNMDKAQTRENLKAVGASGTALIGTESLRRGISGAGQALIEKAGYLTPEDMDLITKNSKEYKKSRSFTDLIEELRKLAEQTSKAAPELHIRGVESLKPLPPISGQELMPVLGDITKAPMMELSPEELPQAKSFKSKSAAELEALLKEKDLLESKINTLQETGLESIERNRELNSLSENLDNVNKKITTTMPDAGRNPVYTVQPSLSDYEKATNIPEEVLQVRPELANKKIQKQFLPVIQEQVDFLKTGKITPYDMAKYIKGLQEATSNSKFPTEAEKFKQELARNMSNKLKTLEGAEGYAEGQRLSRKAIIIEKALKDYGLSLDQVEKDGTVNIRNNSKIENIYKKGNQREIDRLNKYIDRAQKLQMEISTFGNGSAASPSIDRFQDEFKFANIKNKVAEAKEKPIVTSLKKLVGTVIGGSTAGTPGAVIGYGAAGTSTTGTKLQELAALAKASKTYKAAAGASKALGPIAALGAGLLASGQSQAAGEPLPLSAAKGVAETLSPPGLSGSEAISQGQIAAEEQIASMTPEELTQAPELPADIMSAQDVVLSNPIITETLKGAAKGLVSPIPDLAKAGKSALESFGTERSLSARERQEKQMQSADNLSESKFETTNGPAITDFANYLESSPDKVAQEYSRVLRQVISSPDREKSAVLFGLNQNPAFRRLTKEYQRK
jgi:hypothetical protein